MRTLIAILVACAALSGTSGSASAQSALERSERDDIVLVPEDNAAMAAAFRKARASLDGFLKLLDAPPPGTHTYSVKLRVSDAGFTEYFWVGNLKRQNERFSGTIDNIPRRVKTVRQGQVMVFGRHEILDWMYLDDMQRRMAGNFTACALLTLETPQAAADYKKRMGLVCD